MKRLIAVIALMALATPALADQTVTIEHEDLFDNGHLSPILTERVMQEESPVNTSIQGHFLWVSYDNDPEVIVSVDVSDPAITGAHISDEGIVTLFRETPEPQPEPDTVDMLEELPEIDWSRLIPFGVHLK